MLNNQLIRALEKVAHINKLRVMLKINVFEAMNISSVTDEDVQQAMNLSDNHPDLAYILLKALIYSRK